MKQKNTEANTDCFLPKGRALEIFLELRSEVDRLPYGSAIPSVRELRRRFSAGQNTVLKAIRFLAANRKLEVSQRKKTRLSDPAHARPPAEMEPHIPFSRLRSNSDTVLAIHRDIRWKWEPFVIAYNQTHKFKITIRYMDNLESLAAAATDSNIDFILFHTHPVLMRALENSMDFIDLTSLGAQLDAKQFYPALFQKNMEGRLWGLSANLIPAVLAYNETLTGALEPLDTWENFDEAIHRMHRTLPSLDYTCLLDGYIIYLLNSGLSLNDPQTGRPHFPPGHFSSVLNRLKSWVDEKLIPPVTDTYYRGFGRSLFRESRIALAHCWFASLPALRAENPKISFFPMPSERNARIYAGAEFFSICMHSMNYEIAWNFMDFILSPENQQLMTRGENSMPIRRDVRPAFLNRMQTSVFDQYLGRTSMFTEDYLFPIRLRLILEAGIDRWIKFGGDLEKELKAIENCCCRHLQTEPETTIKRKECIV